MEELAPLDAPVSSLFEDVLCSEALQPGDVLVALGSLEIRDVYGLEQAIAVRGEWKAIWLGKSSAMARRVWALGAPALLWYWHCQESSELTFLRP